MGQAVVGEGCADAQVVFVGEAPGRHEAESGRPFVGKAGQWLRRAIRRIGLNEDAVYLTEFRPSRRKPTATAVAHGRIHLRQQIDHQPTDCRVAREYRLSRCPEREGCRSCSTRRSHRAGWPNVSHYLPPRSLNPFPRDPPGRAKGFSITEKSCETTGRRLVQMKRRLESFLCEGLDDLTHVIVTPGLEHELRFDGLHREGAGKDSTTRAFRLSAFKAAVDTGRRSCPLRCAAAPRPACRYVAVQTRTDRRDHRHAARISGARMARDGAVARRSTHHHLARLRRAGASHVSH